MQAFLRRPFGPLKPAGATATLEPLVPFTDTADYPDSYQADPEARPVRGLYWIHGRNGFTPITRNLLIGRADHADVTLDTTHVSREHLSLELEGDTVTARDLGSKNGTFVNGQPISAQTLAHSAILRVGDTVALFWQERGPVEAGFRAIASGVYGGPTLARSLEDLRPVARSALSVVLVGQTGSGKEAIARAVHELSGRKGPLITVNCATIPEQLAEAQLFGHRRGAFTGALTSEMGYFRAAEGGTLFLDEVVELSLPVQAKLLRAVQESEYVPVGETRPIPANVRILCATQRALELSVERGSFRQDLAARLDGYQFHLPALVDRREDVPFLFRRFLDEAIGGQSPELSPRAVETLCLYPWPGNVRELVNTARQVALLRSGEPAIRYDHLPERLRHQTARPEDGEHAAKRETAASPPERPHDPDSPVAKLEEALLSQRGNVQKAAQQVGISRGRAYRIIATGQVDVTKFRSEKK